MAYGPHLIMEVYNSPKEILINKELLYNFLDNLPSQIGMTKIIQPQIIQYSEPPDTRWGYSGWVLIAESHIIFHNYPEDNFITIDIFSCKPFDEQKTIQIIKNHLKFTEYEHHLFKRGTHYPDNNPDYVEAIVHIDRAATAARCVYV